MWEVDRKAHTWKVLNFVMSSSLVVVVMGNSRSVFRLVSYLAVYIFKDMCSVYTKNVVQESIRKCRILKSTLLTALHPAHSRDM